jgi:hypothetical protein
MICCAWERVAGGNAWNCEAGFFRRRGVPFLFGGGISHSKGNMAYPMKDEFGLWINFTGRG